MPPGARARPVRLPTASAVREWCRHGQIKPGAAWLESRALRPDASDATRRRRTLRLLCAALTASVLGSLALAPAAFANFITPKAGGSPNADQIH